MRESEKHAPLIRARGVTRSFGTTRPGTRRQVRALDGVSIEVEAGTALALLGESGSGKTTLGLCLARLVEPDGGEILFRNSDVLQFRGRTLRDYRRQVQVVFQDSASSLNPAFTVEECIEEPLRIERACGREEIRDRAIATMRAVGLAEECMRRRPGMLSGGQRQRVALARALMLRPALIVLDEVLRGLDLIIQSQILELLRGVRREWGLTYLFITHDFDSVGRLADRVAVMHDGRIVEEGTVDGVLSNPQHPETRRLIGARLSIAQSSLPGAAQ